MQIYLTGDLHGQIDIEKLSNKNWKKQKDLTQDDYLIICGDFGLVWSNPPPIPGNRSMVLENDEQYWLDWLEQKPYNILFCDGNHENFDLLNAYPIEEWNGGKVHRIRSNILHLMRGYSYELGKYKFFVFGGAESHDKKGRKKGKSIWDEELPSEAEIVQGYKGLSRFNYNVDFIISHCAPTYIEQKINRVVQPNILTHFLESVANSTNFQAWFMGHYHIDTTVDGKFHVLYNDIVNLKDYID